MAKTKSKSLPIAQMVSQDQTSEFIALFLQKIFKRLKPPNEVVSDESKALLKAITKTFTECSSLKSYITSCMSSLEYETTPPSCYIRIDRAHFVKNTTRKVKYHDYRKQNFFRCVLGYLISCNSFETAKKVISDFFTLILNRYDGYDESQAELPAESAKRRLLALCSSHDETEDYSDDSDIPEEEDSEKDLDFDVDSAWIETIIEKVLIKDSTNYHENLYFSPDEKKMFKQIFSSIVLWSNVMNSKFVSSFDVATSADVESYFKSLKSGILQHKVLRADEFLQSHIDFVNSEIKLNAISVPTTKAAVKETKAAVKRKRSNSLEARTPSSKGT